MVQTSKSAAVAIARAHVEAWSNHDFGMAQKSLAADVEVTIATTMDFPTTHLVGVDNYMEGLTQFANNVKPGSLRVDAGVGDERNALLTVALQADHPEHGAMTLQMARLYSLDEDEKIKVEQVIYYAVPD
jgi:hypothetical protein